MTNSSPLQIFVKNWQRTYGYLSGRLVRIASLCRENKGEIAQHLLSLSSRDRYFRFGFAASDAYIHNYVDGLNFERDRVYGIYNHQARLVATAHVAHMSETNQAPLSFGLGFSHKAEFGVSVLAECRGKGYGGRLFNRAVIHARNQGVTVLHIHALTENAEMLHIAKKGGATLINYGSETEAHLALPKADLDSRMSELTADHFGNADSLAHGKNWFQTLPIRLAFGR